MIKPLNDSRATSQITGTELTQPIRVLFVPNGVRPLMGLIVKGIAQVSNLRGGTLAAPGRTAESTAAPISLPKGAPSTRGRRAVTRGVGDPSSRAWPDAPAPS